MFWMCATNVQFLVGFFQLLINEKTWCGMGICAVPQALCMVYVLEIVTGE